MPMLPEALSNGLCSLRPDEDRACLAVWITHRPQGRSSGPGASAAADALARAADLHAGAGGSRRAADALTAPLLEPVIRPLYAAYERLLERAPAARHDRSRSARAQVVLGTDGRLAGITARAAARQPHADRGVHDRRQRRRGQRARGGTRSPACTASTTARSRSSSRRWPQLLEHLGVPWSRTAKRPGDFPGCCRRWPSRACARWRQLRAAQPGAGRLQPDEHRPFRPQPGRYAHFTSPIRRYSDLVVHRALIRRGPRRGRLGRRRRWRSWRAWAITVAQRARGHGGRAARPRAAHGAVPGRPDRRALPGTGHTGVYSACSSSWTRPGPTASCRSRRWATMPSPTSATTPWWVSAAGELRAGRSGQGRAGRGRPGPGQLLFRLETTSLAAAPSSRGWPGRRAGPRKPGSRACTGRRGLLAVSTIRMCLSCRPNGGSLRLSC